MGNSRLPLDGVVCPRRLGVGILASASLYFLLVSELHKSTDLFLADKVNVLRTMLRDRPDDWDALREEIELESAARRYQQFYIRLLDERNSPLLTTPEMEEQLDLADLTAKTRGRKILKKSAEQMDERF